MPTSAPVALRKPHTEWRHGHAMADPYAWLKDPNWQQVLQDPSSLQPEIRAYLDAENAYTAQATADQKGLHEALFNELKGRLPGDDTSVPLRDGAYAYFQHFSADQEYPVYQRQAASGVNEVLLDVRQLAAGRTFCHIGSVHHSWDHQLVAYTVDLNGSERYELRIQSARGGDGPCEVISDARPQFVWCPSSQYLFYIALDEHQRPKWVKRHALGTSAASDVVVYEERNPGFFLTIELAASRDFVIIKAYDHTCSEAHVLPVATPLADFQCLQSRAPQCEYEVAHRPGQFIMTIHEPGAKDGRIMVSRGNLGSLNWQPLVPYQPGVLIQEVLAFAGHLVRLVMVDATAQIIVRDLSSGDEHPLSFAEPAYFLTLVRGYEFATTVLRFTYSSMTTPEQTYDYDMTTRERTLLKQQPVPSGHNPDDYELVRLQAPARDGAVVPLTLLRRRQRDGASQPLLLYAYGSYGRSMPASFSPHRFTLVDRGVAYAVAHVRGGKEKGFAWYEAALREQKKNTFHDYIDCAQHLIDIGVTSKGRVIGHGASAGGMLIGAVANMASELFLGLVADVPFVDVLNTMWDKDLPLTPPEWPEWGNPITSKDMHDYIASYSPYDNVCEQVYPHLLVLAGLTDPRVTYWEPTKWVAKLRALKKGHQTLLLDVNMGAGHGGASGRFDILHKVARIYGFALTIAEAQAGGR